MAEDSRDIGDGVLWGAIQRALPHTERIRDAATAPDSPGKETAMAAAMTAVGGDLSAVLVAWARISGLPGIPGREVFAGDLAGPSPAPWVPHAIALVDAGLDGGIGPLGAAGAAALRELGDRDLSVLAWQLFYSAGDVLACADGFRHLLGVWARHRDAFDRQAWPPGTVTALGPASLAAAAMGAGHRQYGRAVLDRCYQRDPGTVRVMLSTWFKLLSRQLRAEPETSVLRVLRLDRDGWPDAFTAGPQDGHEKAAEIVAGIVTAMARDDTARAEAALQRMSGLGPDGTAMAADILAGSVGLQFSGEPG